MYIKCWGSRGSIPVSGADYIKYGGDTTCLEIRTKSDDIIIVDAGTGVRRLGNKLVKENRDTYHFLFTHAHWDHVMGLPYFKPLFLKTAKLHMHRCLYNSKHVDTIVSQVMTPPHFPVEFSELQAEILYEDTHKTQFDIGSVSISPIKLSHPNGGSGFKFVENGKVFVFLTDNDISFVHPDGLKRKDYLEFSKDADLLIHDAEYTPQEYERFTEWGHSKYTEVLELALEAGVKKFGLFHLNQERTDREMDEIVEECRQNVAVKGKNLDCFGVGCDMTFIL
ncbi:MAG: MBL fold metallo-hydrolase [Deltaproteobacteria bacterium]|nr:MBL fold metallo-hydrolase [Deltaproteobacteria bacterium]